MTKVIIYLVGWIIGLTLLWIYDLKGLLPEWLQPYQLGYRCALIGALGGITYCLRAVYINKCVKGHWNELWHTWYYLRPILSLVVGAVAFVFLNAGLLVLDAGQPNQSSPFGFLALSFIAGLNVDRFLAKIEDLAKVTWGIEPSRAAEFSTSNLKEGKQDETKNS